MNNNNRPILSNDVLNQHVNSVYPEPLPDQPHNAKVGRGFKCLNYVSNLEGVEDAELGAFVLRQRDIERNAENNAVNPPVWFAQAMQALNDRLDSMNNSLNAVKVQVAKSNNGTASIGAHTLSPVPNFQVEEPPAAFPQTMGKLDELSEVDANTLIAFYFPNNEAPHVYPVNADRTVLQQKRDRIANFIGIRHHLP